MELKNLLKRATIKVESLDEEVEVVELSFAQQAEIRKAAMNDDPIVGLLVVKYCLQLDEPVEELADKMPLRLVQEISGAVQDAFRYGDGEDSATDEKAVKKN